MTTQIILAFLGGGLAGITAMWLGFRQLHSSNVVAERQKWREALRSLACELGARSCSDELWVKLAVRLNPFDQSERELIALAKANKGRQLSPPDAAKAVDQITLLLKHDWERAKIESSLWPFSASRRATHRVDKQRLRSSSSAP